MQDIPPPEKDMLKPQVNLDTEGDTAFIRSRQENP